MRLVTNINPERIKWCCTDYGVSLSDLAESTKISLDKLEKVIEGEDALTIRQLQRIARFFSRGLLFFVEQTELETTNVHSLQYRTITNQKPTLSPPFKALVERIERHRELYISLKEDLGENIKRDWYPNNLELESLDIKTAAERTRKWLKLNDSNTFESYRRAVEEKNILVILSNGYNGKWKIPNEESVRGFSLYFPKYPVILVRKQRTDGPQAFTLFHELAHLLIHRNSYIDEEEDFYKYKGVEKAANEFAGMLLVPDRYLSKLNVQELLECSIDKIDGLTRDRCNEWCVSTEVILRRLTNEGVFPKTRYEEYRKWRQSLPAPVTQTGGTRYRYREPVRIFGEPFVGTVLDALHSNQITLARASTYLDNLKIKDVHKLESSHVHV